MDILTLIEEGDSFTKQGVKYLREHPELLDKLSDFSKPIKDILKEHFAPACNHNLEERYKLLAPHNRKVYYHFCPSCGFNKVTSKNTVINLECAIITEEEGRPHRDRNAAKDWIYGSLNLAAKKYMYQLYLLTPEWIERRTQVIARAGGTCERCHKDEIHQVHHLTYKRIFNEPLEDLLGVCEPCHRQIHHK